jgi:trehalose 6-phosphate phosphatase
VKHLLARNQRAMLATLGRSRVLLAFDFDGTLAPLVARRETAHMHQRTRELLVGLCEVYPCAVVSGRSVADLTNMLQGAPVQHVVGNHGLEPGDGLPAFEQLMTGVRQHLERMLQGAPGVEIEDKRYSLSIHYRRSRDKQHARKAILKAVEALPPNVSRMVAGKMVVNVVPAEAPHKGHALRALCQSESVATALYVGDDTTDEDVFRLGTAQSWVTARVGVSKASAAAYFLRNQKEIDGLLARLLALRNELHSDDEET